MGIEKILQKPLTPKLKDMISSGFREHAIQTVGKDGFGHAITFVAMENGVCTGAIVIHPFWSALHIKHLWVRKGHRRKKIGKRLVTKAFEYGDRHRCAFAFVETMSFQAIGFYQKMGFILEFTRGGYFSGLKLHYLRRDFLKQK